MAKMNSGKWLGGRSDFRTNDRGRSYAETTTDDRHDGPQARDDDFAFGEDSGAVVWLDVLANDRGCANRLLSVDQEDLSHRHSYETLASGATISIVDGKIAYQPVSGMLQALAAGETFVETFTYSAEVGNGRPSSATVTITFVGANDAPLVSYGELTGAAEEIADAAPGETTALHQATGVIGFADVDLSDTHSIEVIPQGAAYRGTLTAALDDSSTNDGTGRVEWTFTAEDGALDDLQAGQVLSQVYTIQIDDGHGGVTSRDVTITIAGSNDAPEMLSLDQSAIAAEIADLAVGENSAIHDRSGTIYFADVDTLDTHLASVSAQGMNYRGMFSLAEIDQFGDSVEWTFTVGDADLDDLAEGQTLVQAYDVAIDDGHGGTASQRVTIMITGTNDAAVVDAIPDGDYWVTEAGAISGDDNAFGQVAVTDVDSGEAAFRVPSLLNGVFGDFTFDAGTGLWSYTLDNSRTTTQELKLGDIEVETLTVTSYDGTATYAISVEVNGTNDPATIAALAGGDYSVIEAAGGVGGDVSASGQLLIEDVDAGEAHFQTPSILSGAYGDFTFDVNTGAWTYTLDDSRVSTQTLADSDLANDSLTVFSFDGTTSETINVEIVGANDAPQASNDVILTNASDGTTITINPAALLANDFDVDSTDLAIGAIGGAQLDTEGNVGVVVAGGSNFEFTYQASDGSTLSDQATVSVQLQSGNIILGTDADEILIGAGPGGAATTDIAFSDTPATISNFGEPGTDYYGQTFIAVGNSIDSISVKLDPRFGPDNTEFHLLLTDVTDPLDPRPTTILFESATITAPYDPLDLSLQTYIVDLSGVDVVAGHTYAVVLDAFVTRDGVLGQAAVGVSSANPYADGHFFFRDFSGGTRETHFATNWSDFANFDMAVQIEYSQQGDQLNGGGGNDVLDGGVGNDFLTGGAGDDLFVFRSGDGEDTIADFTPGADRLDLTGIILADANGDQVRDFSDLVALMSDDGPINFGSGDSLTLVGVTKTDLQSGDVIL